MYYQIPKLRPTADHLRSTLEWMSVSDEDLRQSRSQKREGDNFLAFKMQQKII